MADIDFSALSDIGTPENKAFLARPVSGNAGVVTFSSIRNNFLSEIPDVSEFLTETEIEALLEGIGGGSLLSLVEWTGNASNPRDIAHTGDYVGKLCMICSLNGNVWFCTSTYGVFQGNTPHVDYAVSFDTNQLTITNATFNTNGWLFRCAIFG